MAATDLRQDVGVEVTLSPAALQLLAQQAAAANTPDLEAQITEKMKQVLSAIFLDSAKEAGQADTALPPLTGDATADASRKAAAQQATDLRSEEHTSELQSLMRISYAVFCLKQKTKNETQP